MKRRWIKGSLNIFGILALLLGISNFIWVDERETLLYKLQQHLTYNDEDWRNYKANNAILEKTKNQTSADTSKVWTQPDLHPYDINKLQGVDRKNEERKIANANFDKLVEATIRPDDEDAQIALIRLTDRRLTDVIINQKLNIKIGKCYENPNTGGNFKCVSCMIILYNRDKKDVQEAPDGENFLRNAYDFYQASKGSEWDAKELSMPIPYDYELVKKYESSKKQGFKQ